MAFSQSTGHANTVMGKALSLKIPVRLAKAGAQSKQRKS